MYSELWSEVGTQGNHYDHFGSFSSMKEVATTSVSG